LIKIILVFLKTNLKLLSLIFVIMDSYDLEPFIGRLTAAEAWRFCVNKIIGAWLDIKSKKLICKHDRSSKA